MPNKEILIDYYDKLSKVLNENGFRQRIKIGGEIHELDYETDKDNPDLTMMGITDSKEAYYFLYSKGLIRKDICHFCGESPVDGRFNFTEPKNVIKFNICRTCHSKGQREQEVFMKSAKPNSGCLVILSLFLFVFIVILIIV
jgi:hypothetical protein